MDLPDGRHAGQNLAASTDAGFTLNEGFQGWIGEIRFYDLKTLKCKGGWYPRGHLTQVGGWVVGSKGGWEPSGHLTQVVR